MVEPPKTGLRQLVGKGQLDPKAVNRAEKRVDSLLENVDPASWSAEPLEKMQGVLDELRAGKPLSEDAKGRLVEAMFDLKGLGGCFGYDLVSGIAHNLYRCLMWGRPPAGRLAGVIDAHCDAIRAVFKNRILGMGGPVGTDLLNSLAHLVGPIEEPKPPSRSKREDQPQA